MHQVEHTEQVINADRELIKQTIDMQTDVRGFLYTGKNEFLQPYIESRQLIESEFTTLNQLVSDNPAQQARLATIHSHFDEWQQKPSTRSICVAGACRPRYRGGQLPEQLATQPVAGIGPCGL